MTDYTINGPIIAGDTGTSSRIKGNSDISGSSNTISLTSESVNVGGSSSSKTLSGTGSTSIGGNALTSTQSGSGSVIVGGNSISTNIVGNGGVSIAAAGLLGLGSGDSNLVLIGGSGTTLQGSGSVAAGPSTLTKLYNPANPKMYVMGSPVITKTGSSFSTPGTLTASSVSGGVIEFTTTPGAYTMPTTSAICAELLDTTLSSFTGTPRHSFSVTFYNNSGGSCTVATGAGQTLTNTTSPVSLTNGESRTWNCIFITPTSLLIEDSSPLTTLTNAGTTSLVNNSTAPNLATKGLVNGTGIGFSSTVTDVTISNTGVTSLSGTANEISVSAATGAVTLSLPSNVTIINSLTISGLTSNSFLYSGTSGLLTATTAPTNGQLLIGNTGNPPTKGTLTAGTAIGVTNGAGTITINNTGVTSITGTTNQVIASASTGAVTLSLPQSIATTSTPTFNQVTITGSVTNGTDTATKAYVDSVAAGLNVRAAAEAATTTNLNAFYTNGTTDASGGLGIGATLTSNVNQNINTAAIIDGYNNFIVGARVLIKNQTNQIANGIYNITDLGSGSTPWILTRSSDYNDSVANQVGAGDFLFVAEGNTQAATSWVQTNVGTGTNPDHIIIGTNPIIFSQFGGAGTYTAGNGLNLTGTTFSLISPVTPANGGTGTTTAPSAGQIPIGTSGNIYSPATLTAGTAIGIVNASGSITINNSGVTAIAGTANEITLSASTGSVTVSLPNNVTIGNSLTVSGLTANSFLHSGTAGILVTTAAPTNGQILIGSTGVSPVAATITAGTGITVTNGAGAITIASSGIYSEPFYTTNSRAIISGTGNTLTNIASNCGGGIFGGSTVNVTITATSGSVAVGGSTTTSVPNLGGLGNVMVGSHNANGTSMSGGGNVVVGSASNAATISSNGNVIIGSNAFNGVISNPGNAVVGSTNCNASITGTGSALIGGATFINFPTISNQGNVIVGGVTPSSYTISGTGCVVLGSSTNSCTLNGQGTVVVGSTSLSSITITGVGAVVIGSASLSASLTGSGAAIIGSWVASGTIGGAGAVVVGSSNLTSTSISGNGVAVVGSVNLTCAVTGSGCVVVGSSSTAGTLQGTSNVIVGGSAYASTFDGAGNVFVGGSGSLIGLSVAATTNGCVIVGSRSIASTISGTSNGCVIVGTNSFTGTISNSNGTVVVGGSSNSGTISSLGAVAIGGISQAISIAGNGCVSIAASGTLGSVAGDSGNVLIGGSGTTVKATNNVVIGSSTVTQTFAPSTAQTFIKSNPIFAWTSNTPITNGGVALVNLTAAQLINGYITRTSGTIAPNFTFPTAPSVYNAAVDNSSGPFGLNMVFYFLIQNIGGTGAITLTTNTGWGTFQGTTGTIGVGTARAGMCILISASTGIIYFFG